MSYANCYCKKTGSFATCNDNFSLHAFYLNARKENLGHFFQDFLLKCFVKESVLNMATGIVSNVDTSIALAGKNYIADR